MTLPFDPDDDPRPDPTVDRTSTGAGHPDTSHEAAERVLPRSGTQRAKVLRYFISIWPEGLTDEEVRIRLDLPFGSALARRNELMNDGWVKDTGQRRITEAGGRAIVWQYVPYVGDMKVEGA